MAAIAATILPTTVACSSANEEANKPPPGLTAHRPGTHATPIAARKGGACELRNQAEIVAGFDARSATPRPDTLSPGSNRCDWTISGSELGKDLDLAIAITPFITTRSSYSASQRSLTTALDKNHRVVYQVVGGRDLASSTRIHAALIRLAQS